MNHVVRQRLVELVARYGHELGLDGPRLKNSLRELCPGDEHKRAVAALTAAAIEGAPVELLRPPAGVPTEALLARLSKRLYDHRGLDDGLARWAVESWALSLGVISSDQLTPLEMPAGQPADAAMADQFRNAVRGVAVNGTLQKDQVEMLNELRRRLGLDKALARRIFDEETKRANATVWRRSRPNELPHASPQQPVHPVLPPPPASTRAVAPPPIQYSPAGGQPTGAELNCPAGTPGPAQAWAPRPQVVAQVVAHSPPPPQAWPSPANAMSTGGDDHRQRHEVARPLPAPSNHASTAAKRTKRGWGLASCGLGTVALLACLIGLVLSSRAEGDANDSVPIALMGFGYLLSLAGIIFGIYALVAGSARTSAWAGITISSLPFFAIACLVVLVIVAVFIAAATQPARRRRS